MLNKKLIFIFISLSNPSFGEEDKNLIIMKNLQSEYANCAAYYHISSLCFSSEKDRKLRENLEGLSEISIKRAILIGKKINMSSDAISSRLELSINNINDIMNNNCINISSILLRYGEKCKLSIDNPEKFINEHIINK
ncbi:hypothetical protein [Elstera cyanobacteriorum]|uniref:hypothetical protein n=1 Tax=Elstera cyanobacteriorum TaxID=2022747 RepID=UPI002355907E|nr:hypothetical protein [Elstera cyanobacteriorum]MCK6442809.1 hypothetical protein [Elstera cyanobacteriorum]